MLILTFKGHTRSMAIILNICVGYPRSDTHQMYVNLLWFQTYTIMNIDKYCINLLGTPVFKADGAN